MLGGGNPSLIILQLMISILKILCWISKIMLILDEILYLHTEVGIDSVSSILETHSLYTCTECSDTTHNKYLQS
jgi:hypothetical protein